MIFLVFNFLRSMALRAGCDFSLGCHDKIGEGNVCVHGGANDRGDHFDTERFCLLYVVIAAVERVSKHFPWAEVLLLCSLNEWDQGMGIAIMRRLNDHSGNQGESIFFFTGAISLGDLYLIPLPLVAVIACIRVRGILHGVGGNVLIY